jgi:hypothetical protein
MWLVRNLIVSDDLAVPIFNVRAMRISNLAATDFLYSYVAAGSNPVQRAPIRLADEERLHLV